jgi:hypothetical protein
MLVSMFRLAAKVRFAGSALAIAACAAPVLELLGLTACGGPEFTLAPPPLDGAAGTNDAPTHAPPDASTDAFADVAETSDEIPERSDGGPADATLDDSPASDGALWLPDAVEEPPPKCASVTGFVCAPAVPPGWSGPLELYSAADASGVRCGAHFQGPVYDGNNVLSAQVATCDCQCQMPQAVQCSPLTASFFAGIGTACAPADHCIDRMLTGACQRVDALSSCKMGTRAASMVVPAATASGGSCMPAVTKTLPPSSWKVGARACVSALGSAPGGCDTGFVCTPQPGAPFAASVCVAQAGDVPCEGGYTARRVFYGGTLDTRDCSPCTCGDVAGATCSASIDVFNLPANPAASPCSGLPTTYRTPAACDPVQQPADFRLNLAASGGSCTPSPVTAVGNVAAAQPTTFCCWP